MKLNILRIKIFSESKYSAKWKLAIKCQSTELQKEIMEKYKMNINKDRKYELIRKAVKPD